ncbi:hypothetical protein [Streptomyces gobitricini]|uniref:CU044_5270 family protein n=1 Tax=Streptomyces gobitricini TaxID=68211 RepID=A0ABN3MV89_9ACTN
MDEMRTLQDFRADAPDADRARLAPGRQRLLDEIGRPRRRLRGGWLLAVAGAVSGVVVAAVLVTHVVPPSDGPRVKAEYATPPEPRDGQWLYRKVLTRQSTLNFRDDNNPVTEKGPGWKPYWTHAAETWTQYGSGKTRKALPAGGMESVVGTSPLGAPKDTRAKLARMPNEPLELMRALRDIITMPKGDPAALDIADYRRIRFAFTELDAIPPKVRLSLFRTLRMIPGVTVRQEPAEDALGRPAIAVHWSDDNEFTQDTHRRDELLLDPETYEFLGERTLLLAGGMIDSKVTTKDTLIQVTAVEKTAVVDKSGTRP